MFGCKSRKIGITRTWPVSGTNLTAARKGSSAQRAHRPCTLCMRRASRTIGSELFALSLFSLRPASVCSFASLPPVAALSLSCALSLREQCARTINAKRINRNCHWMFENCFTICLCWAVPFGCRISPEASSFCLCLEKKPALIDCRASWIGAQLPAQWAVFITRSIVHRIWVYSNLVPSALCADPGLRTWGWTR